MTKQYMKINIHVSKLSKSNFFTIVQNHHEKESRVKIAVKERADHPVHPHRHINTFSARYLDSILHLYNRICNHWLAMAAQQAG